MKKEIRIGLLGICSLFILIFGYKFLKGQNILDDSHTYQIRYDNVQQLAVSDGVYINGYKVGSVLDINLDPKDANFLIVEIQVDGDLPLPKETIAEITPDGVLGNKLVNLNFDKLCTANCLENGDFMKGEVVGLLGSMVGEPEEIDSYIGAIKESIGEDEKMKASVTNIESTIAQLNSVTSQLDQLLAASNQSLSNTFRNLDRLTTSLAQNRETFAGTMNNLQQFSQDLKDSDIKGTMQGVKQTLTSADQSFEKLESTILTANQSLGELQNLLKGINKGEGSLGKVLKDDALANKIEQATTNLNLLLQDFRLNPKRYVNVSVFGKKQKDYKVPKDDPAFQD